MLNKFQKKIDSYIQTQQALSLRGFTNRTGGDATWSCYVWVFTQPNGEEIKYYFANPLYCKQPHISIPLRKDQQFPEQVVHILMAYTLEINSRNLTPGGKKSKLNEVKKFMSFLKNPLCYLSQDILIKYEQKYADISYPWQRVLNTFLTWCMEKGFISRKLKLLKATEQTRDGSEQDYHNKENLPDEDAILALAAIFNETVPEAFECINIHTVPQEFELAKLQTNLQKFELIGLPIDPLKCQRDAFVAGMAALAMSSPNRITAEQCILDKQRLKGWTQKNKESKSEITYYLDWHGSKGYKDNRNHILSAMAAPIHRTMEYFNKACETGRILCRFYENPNAPLVDHIGDFINDKIQSVDTNKPVHLLQLGYLLGFYDNSDGLISININLSSGEKKITKEVHKLVNSDILCLKNKNGGAKAILGCGISKRAMKDELAKNLTVEEFQTLWIRHIKKQFPIFPKASNKTEKGNVQLSSSLFCFTGRQIFYTSNGASYKFGTSFYAIVPITSLGSLFSGRLSNLNKPPYKNIFQSYFGSDCELSIRPHQFRHWINDIAEKSGIPRQIITAWSGRVDPEQTLTYIHTSNEEKVSRVRQIFDEHLQDEREIKVITQEEYERTVKVVTTTTVTGFCTQNLMVSPCGYLNDFVFQCVLCGEGCHVNRDTKAIEFLRKDLNFQHRRLDQCKSNLKLLHSDGMQKWFKLHHSNTALLQQLIDLMERTDIEAGSPIRFVKNEKRAEFRVSNLQQGIVNRHPAKLPDSKKELALCIENLQKAKKQKTATPSNTGLDDLLTKFGIKDEALNG